MKTTSSGVSLQALLKLAVKFFLGDKLIERIKDQGRRIAMKPRMHNKHKEQYPVIFLFSIGINFYELICAGQGITVFVNNLLVLLKTSDVIAHYFYHGFCLQGKAMVLMQPH